MIRNLKRYPNPKNTTKCNQLKIIIFNSIRSLWKPFKQNLNPNTIIWADFSSGHFLKFYQSATVINLMTDGLKFISTENGSILRKSIATMFWELKDCWQAWRIKSSTCPEKMGQKNIFLISSIFNLPTRKKQASANALSGSSLLKVWVRNIGLKNMWNLEISSHKTTIFQEQRKKSVTMTTLRISEQSSVRFRQEDAFRSVFRCEW